MSKILLAIDYGINNIGIVLFNKKKKIIFNYKNIYFLFFFKKIKKYIIKYKINNIIIG
ncbi:MAG: hypothetical protein ABUS76_00190 [Candidatus Shikimatogenerans sp. Ttur]|uniref:Holliday junction resolvase RuvX n=1 Tax=Candidatus Shikimatogenerans sp. Ttur TaxID=3158569 RepID=A0AAU7ZXQ3_9FLAO